MHLKIACFDVANNNVPFECTTLQNIIQSKCVLTYSNTLFALL